MKPMFPMLAVVALIVFLTAGPGAQILIIVLGAALVMTNGMDPRKWKWFRKRRNP